MTEINLSLMVDNVELPFIISLLYKCSPLLTPAKDNSPHFAWEKDVREQDPKVTKFPLEKQMEGILRDKNFVSAVLPFMVYSKEGGFNLAIYIEQVKKACYYLAFTPDNLPLYNILFEKFLENLCEYSAVLRHALLGGPDVRIGVELSLPGEEYSMLASGRCYSLPDIISLYKKWVKQTKGVQVS